MPKFKTLAVLVAAGALSACATTARQSPVDVTRFHLGVPIERSTVQIEPASGATMMDSEYQAYASAVENQLHGLGYVTTANPGTSAVVATVSVTSTLQGSFRDRPPVTIGLGGGSFSGGRHGGVGVGGDVGFGIGGKRRNVIVTELGVQIRRRSDNSVVWEGKAQSQSIEAPGEIPLAAHADRMAAALFKDFPGESGITTTVK